MTQPLSRLERVDLRGVWAKEDTDFTPWLAKDENLKLLGDTIGMELERGTTEENVGPFNADILCKNTDDDSWVVIENQIEKTDHRHLGQLLTYGAGLDAFTMVWIASKFTKEHRAVLDRLNKITDEEFRFFGLEVEVWQIDDSLPAPKFNIISQPNNWSKSFSRDAQKINDGTLSKIKIMQKRYWQTLEKYLEDTGSKLNPQTPKGSRWYHLSTRIAGVKIIAVMTPSENKIRVELNIDHSDYTEEFFNFLHDEKDAIETEIGVSLEWLELPENARSRIAVYKEADIKDEKDWTNQHAWLKEMMESFYRVFRVRIKAIAEEIKTQ